MDRVVVRFRRWMLRVVVTTMLVGSAHAWLIRPRDDPQLTRRQDIAARMLPPYAAYLLLADVHHALVVPRSTREAFKQCLVSLQAQGYAEWTRVAACECHALEGESLDACFARH